MGSGHLPYYFTHGDSIGRREGEWAVRHKRVEEGRGGGSVEQNVKERGWPDGFFIFTSWVIEAIDSLRCARQGQWLNITIQWRSA